MLYNFSTSGVQRGEPLITCCAVHGIIEIVQIVQRLEPAICSSSSILSSIFIPQSHVAIPEASATTDQRDPQIPHPMPSTIKPPG